MRNLELERRKRGLSQGGLARLSGVDKPTISRAENGRMIPYKGQIAKLAAALDWPADPADLLREVEL